jgi:hypothetical protein
LNCKKQNCLQLLISSTYSDICAQGQELTLKFESGKGLHSGRLTPCQQILDYEEWKWLTTKNCLAYYDTG